MTEEEKSEDLKKRAGVGVTGTIKAGKVATDPAGNLTHEAIKSSIDLSKALDPNYKTAFQKEDEKQAALKALKEATPSWAKDGKGLRGVDYGEKVMSRAEIRAFERQEGRPPTVSEYLFESAQPDEKKEEFVPSTPGTSLAHPWKIHQGITPSGGRQFGVEYRSDVYDGVTWTKKTVSGLLTNPANPNDSGWFPARQGFVYLNGTVDENGNVTSIQVDDGVAELSGIDRVKAVSGKQTKFAWVVGYIWSEGSGDNKTWYVRQEAFRHVTLLYVVVNGVLCKVPFEM